MDFFSSWFFIGLMAFLLVALAIIGPIVIVVIAIRASQKPDREPRRERE